MLKASQDNGCGTLNASLLSLLFCRRIQEILPQRMAEWKKTPSYADAKAEETLKELAKKKQVRSIFSRLEALKISLQVFHLRALLSVLVV